MVNHMTKVPDSYSDKRSKVQFCKRQRITELTTCQSKPAPNIVVTLFNCTLDISLVSVHVPSAWSVTTHAQIW